MRDSCEVNRVIETYADTVKRICMLHLKNISDTEDIFQEVFLKYSLYSHPFESSEHEKAWIIRVTINKCKDLLKNFFRRKTTSIESAIPIADKEQVEYSHVLEAVISLPQKYKDAVYLHYYEGYTAAEIGNILNKNTNTVYTLLARARKILKEKLGEYEYEE